MSEAPLRYLMVEDDPLDIEIISAMLMRGATRPLQLSVLSRFADARELLSRESFSAVILDLNLPDGYGTGNIALLVEHYPTLPIVILTGNDDEETAIACLQLGAQDYVSKNQVNAELLSRVMQYAIERKRIDQQLKLALDEADKRNAELSLLARTDSLTRLPNRAYFYEVTQQAIASAERMRKSLGLLYFDLNGFKAINDTYGHGVGDLVLVEIGRRLKDSLRHGDTVARFGGDEFVVLSTMLEDSVQSYSLARKVHQIISAPMDIEGYTLHLSASIGIATYPEVDTVDKLLECADLAMYEAKSSRQHFACFYTKKLAAKHQQQRQIEERLESAVSEGGMSMAFQPIISADHPEHRHVEALARWYNIEMGTVSTGRFIPVAESAKFGEQLGDFALECLARLYHEAKAVNLAPQRLTLNVFGNQFNNPDYAHNLLKSIKRLHLPRAIVGVEIAENQLIEHFDACASQFKELQANGVKITLDNFGTGDLALRHIQQLGLDAIKLDRTMTANIHCEPEQAQFIAALVGMAHAMGIKIIASGIEQEEEYQTLKKMACDEFQGYLFSHPLSADATLEAWQATASNDASQAL